jgi:methionyl-tRNA formyltransferase
VAFQRDRGSIKTSGFKRTFVEDWAPDLCLMATFGQLIPKRLFTVPRLGFYNFHHSDVTWPSYPGPDPIGDMLRDGKTHVVITRHQVSEVLDGGRFYGARWASRSSAEPVAALAAAPP